MYDEIFRFQQVSTHRVVGVRMHANLSGRNSLPLFLKVFMMIYLGTLPLVLIPKFDYLTLIGMFFAVYAFVGIEEIGLEIEDPFGDDPNDLPIEQICQGTKRDVAEILGVKNN